MNEADLIFLGGIEMAAQDVKMEIKLLNSYIDVNYCDHNDKDLFLRSFDRIDEKMNSIYSLIDKIKSEEYI